MTTEPVWRETPPLPMQDPAHPSAHPTVEPAVAVPGEPARTRAGWSAPFGQGAPPADSERDAAAVGAAAVRLGGSATVNAQLWLQESPWRPTAGWAVVAGLLAYGFLARSFYIDWRMVALALLLADPLWGSIWRLAGGRDALLPLHRQARRPRVWLPYLLPGSPAARLLGWDERGVQPLILRVVLPTVTVPLAIGWVLGAHALWLTLAVIVISGLAWTWRHLMHTLPALLQSFVTITLPWVLILGLLGMTRNVEFFGFQVALILLWTIHHWGEERSLRYQSDSLGIGLLAVADLGVGLLLIVAQAPFWLALLAILWLPTYIILYQGKSADRLSFWWLAAMLLSSAAIGSRML